MLELINVFFKSILSFQQIIKDGSFTIEQDRSTI